MREKSWSIIHTLISFSFDLVYFLVAQQTSPSLPKCSLCCEISFGVISRLLRWDLDWKCKVECFENEIAGKVMTGRGEGGCVCLIPCSESESMGRFHHHGTAPRQCTSRHCTTRHGARHHQTAMQSTARHHQAELQCITSSTVHSTIFDGTRLWESAINAMWNQMRDSTTSWA